MSLVNDALKKARLEAARGDAANRNVPYPALGRGEGGSSRAWIAAFGGLILLAGLGGFFLFRAGKQSAMRTETATQAGLPNGAEPAIPQKPGAAARGAGDELNGPGDRVAPKVADSGTADGSPRTGSKENRASPPSPSVKNGPSSAQVEPAGSTRIAGTVPSAARGTESLPPPSPEIGPEPEQQRTVRPAPAPPPSTTKERPASRTPAQVAPGNARPSPNQATEVLRSADIPGAGPVELGGIAWSGDRPFALLNGRVVRPGDSVAGLMVTEIQSNTVRLSGAAGDWILKLK